MKMDKKETSGTGPQVASPVGNPVLGVCLVGGGVAWFLHLLLSILVAEFGCVAGFGEVRFGGINLVAWSLILVTAITWSGGLAVTVLSYRVSQRIGGDVVNGEVGNGRFFAARVGFTANLSFVFVILVESFPILYFLHDC